MDPPQISANKELKDPKQMKTIEKFKSKYSIPGVKSPYEKSWWIGKLFFTWALPIIWVSRKVPFQQDMNYNPRPKDKVENQIINFERNWNKLLLELIDQIKSSIYSVKKPKIIYKALWRTYKYKIIVLIVLSLIMSAVGYINTLIQMFILEEFTRRATKDYIFDVYYIGFLVLIICFIKVSSGLINGQITFQMGLLGIQIRNVLSAMIIKKVLKKPLSREKEFHSGNIITLCSTDTEKFAGICDQMNQIMLLPFQIILGIVISVIYIGWQIIIALVCVLIILGVNGYFASKLSDLFEKIMATTDERIKQTNECFSNIRFIKISALENAFIQKICNIKKVELASTWVIQKMWAFLDCLNNLGQPIFILSLVLCLTLFGDHVSVPVLFTAINLYGLFGDCMQELPFFAQELSE